MNSHYGNYLKLCFTKKIGLILLLFNLAIPLSISQNQENNRSELFEKSFSEELYIKTDRDIYIAGEEIWFKIYKLNGLTHTPANLSKVIYIDFLDIYNNPVKQLKVETDGFSGSGGLRLPDTLSTGNYILRSYTNWMQNFSKDLFSYKRISVINPFEKIVDIKIPSQNNIPEKVIFSPEGGQLITGITTRVGFRSVNENGDPVVMKGAFIYENNDTICYVETEKNGYGWASIKPSGLNKIFLVTTNSEGLVKKFSLPDIQQEGITLSLLKKDKDSPILLKINKSKGFTPRDTRLYLILHTANLPFAKKEINIENDLDLILSPDDLPHGLAHLIIMDGLENQYADRWIYIETGNLLNFKITIQNNTSNPREKIKLGISATDDKGDPVESDFSISVAKAFSVNKDLFKNNKYRQLPILASLSSITNESDINDYLLFYSPFDQLLIPNGTGNLKTPSYIPELEGHLVSGNIRDRESGEPLKNENITLSFVGKAALCQFSKTDEEGDFNFLTTEHGLHEIVIQPLSAEINDCYVELKNPFNISFNNYNHGVFYLDRSMLGEINNAIISMQINNIYKPFSQASENNLSLPGMYNFYGNPDNSIQMSRYIELTSLREVVKEIMPGVSIAKKNDKTNFRLINRFPGQPFENNPLVLVDGVPIHDLEQVLSINSSEIEKIDVLNTRYFISDAVLEGILNFVSIKGNLEVIDFDRSVFRQEYDLLQDPKMFYSPDYSSGDLKDNRVPDYRNTLFWNPDLQTDKSGKATVEFFTSDESGEYIILIEGISPNGKTGVSSIPLIVKSR